MSLLLFQAELIKYNLKQIELYQSEYFGPLKYIDSKILHYFSHFYALVQPQKNTELLLYKLDCFSTRNFYSPNRQLSELLNKKYSKDKDVNFKTILIQDCFRLFIAELNVSLNKFETVRNLTGLQMCCFIPSEYLDFIESSQHGLPCVRITFIENALKSQKEFFNRYITKTNELNRKYLEKYFTLKRAIKLANKGQFNDNVPCLLRNILIKLKKSNHFKIDQKLPDKTYELHTTVLNLPDGRNLKFSLICHADYLGYEMIKVKKLKNQIIEEKIHKYSLVFNWI